MTVFVDDVRLPYGRMIMCHMWAAQAGPDGQYSEDIDELCLMADRIGVARKWIQGHPTLSFGKHRQASWVHFDIALAAKKKALDAGALLTDRYGPLEHSIKLGRRSSFTLENIRRLRERASLPLDGIIPRAMQLRPGDCSRLIRAGAND